MSSYWGEKRSPKHQRSRETGYSNRKDIWLRFSWPDMWSEACFQFLYDLAEHQLTSRGLLFLGSVKCWVWAAVGLIQLKPSMSLPCPSLWEQDGQEHRWGQSAVRWLILSLSFSREARRAFCALGIKAAATVVHFLDSVCHSCLWTAAKRWVIWAVGDLSGGGSERWGIWAVGDLSDGGSEWWVIWAWGIWVVGNGAAWMGSISSQFTVLELFKTAPHLLKEWTVARQNLCCDWSRSCFHYFLSCRWCYIPGPTRVTLEEGVWKIHGTWCLGKLSQALREDWLG